VTDPKNRLREHQKLLLIGLRAFGFPYGYDSKSWWDRHGRLFYAESDPTKALLLIRGWADRMYLLLEHNAVSDLEPENDEFFRSHEGPFFMAVERAERMEEWCRRSADKRRLEAVLEDGNNMALSAVVWWPRRRQLPKSLLQAETGPGD
jgi:hypothetical protein